MKSLHPRASRLAAAAATAVIALGIGAPVAAGLGTPATLVDDGANPVQTTTSPPPAPAPLTISPSSGGANPAVTVRSSCAPSGPATSDAFQQSITLQQSGNQWVGTGRIRTSGLTVGRTYTVTVRCTDGVTLSTSFTYTSTTPSGGASAGFGGAAGGAGGASTAATMLAVGGGLAIAGTVGYAFFNRRRRVGSHY
ncbi:hypothetical protein [Streptomyces specialis]|uniref:hypothetical protein n=1 Tax=Streptomyces specialis TaxID=498367 RepID=UPI00073F359E|nr:hypothetical protein [Streptomyces specialis]